MFDCQGCSRASAAGLLGCSRLCEVDLHSNGRACVLGTHEVISARAAHLWVCGLGCIRPVLLFGWAAPGQCCCLAGLHQVLWSMPAQNW